ncbi:MAG: T9SS type A sorting domain-containing protein [Bacteroidales bacterium]|nr:T9SS type A sorting domain-containing protein [Bacteroidales bacterium]
MRKTQSLQTTQIDLSSYTPGVYLMKLVGDGRVIGVKKVVKE